MSNCYFCASDGGTVLYKCDLYRIVLVDETDYVGYLRIIANKHYKELTDLDFAQNLKMYKAVIASEQIIRQVLSPDKVNIASLGNITPHIHWHVIPRFANDRHFPNSIWGAVVNSNYSPSSELKNKLFDLTTAFTHFDKCLSM